MFYFWVHWNKQRLRFIWVYMWLWQRQQQQQKNPMMDWHLTSCFVMYHWFFLLDLMKYMHYLHICAHHQSNKKALEDAVFITCSCPYTEKHHHQMNVKWVERVFLVWQLLPANCAFYTMAICRQAFAIPYAVKHDEMVNKSQLSQPLYIPRKWHTNEAFDEKRRGKFSLSSTFN